MYRICWKSHLLVLASLLFYSGSAYAAVPSINTMLESLDQSLPYVQDMVFAVSYAAGILFVFRALYDLKIYGELRTMMASQTSLKKPVMLLIAAGMMIYLPTAIHYTQQTLFDRQGNILQYADVSSQQEPWSGSLGTIFDIVRIVGLISFVRGWFILADSGAQGQQPNTFNKGLTHVIGGILAFNIMYTTKIIGNTLGFS